MVITILIATSIFFLFTFIFWKFTNAYYKKKTTTKIQKTMKTNIYYWESIIMFSSAATFLVLYLLKWLHFLSF